MQNLIFLMEPSEAAWRNSMQAGNMCLNRFCIDESAAFELSGVNYLNPKGTIKFGIREDTYKQYIRLEQEREIKGKEFSFLLNTLGIIGIYFTLLLV